jgi:hypothetical protein
MAMRQSAKGSFLREIFLRDILLAKGTFRRVISFLRRREIFDLWSNGRTQTSQGCLPISGREMLSPAKIERLRWRVPEAAE